MDSGQTTGGENPVNSKIALNALLQNRIVLLLLRWTVAGIFIYSGFQKIGAPQNFADSIASFAILPDSLINPVALSLPLFEVLLALAVVTGIQRRPALLGIVVLMAVFMVALGSAIARGIVIDCGCFGSEEPSVGAAWRALLRDIPVLAMALWLYFSIFQTSANAFVGISMRNVSGT